MVRSDRPRRRLERRRKKVTELETLSNQEKRLILEICSGIENDDIQHTSPIGNKPILTNENYVVRLRKLTESYEGNFADIIDTN